MDSDDEALARRVRRLAKVMAKTHRGWTVEIRIPGITAFQIGIGQVSTTHRRGTPPHVVEMTGQVFLDLCDGTSSWPRALENHLVTTSGAHGDVGHLFPFHPLP